MTIGLFLLLLALVVSIDLAAWKICAWLKAIHEQLTIQTNNQSSICALIDKVELIVKEGTEDQ